MINEQRSENNENILMNTESENDDHPKYSAFTVAELGEIIKPIKIPHGIFIGNKCHMILNISVTLNGCELIHYYEAGFSEGKELICSYDDENEANARAKMLIYLIEKGLIKND